MSTRFMGIDKRAYALMCRLDLQSASFLSMPQRGTDQLSLVCGLASLLARRRVEQTNFDTCQMLRMNEAPAIEVHIIQSFESPGGMGECGTSAIVAQWPTRSLRQLASACENCRSMPAS
jgi:hypothetical protein